ncbi:MAG TPA: hypothetical protein VFJ19_09765 [Nocardioidaceae bacterium]|nr:hypothetical protein [Nocardioidaceae bacterium]
MNRIVKRMALPVGAAIILGSSGFAFMAGNTVPDSAAGAGTGDILPYDVSSVQYDYTTSGPGADQQHITSVTFTLNHSANPGKVKAYIEFPTSQGQSYWDYFNCNERGTAGSGVWTCTPSTGGSATLSGANKLVVLAAQ